MPDKEWTYPDGGKFTEHEDGSYTVTDPNGAKTHIDPATGKKTETPPPNPDGTPGGPPTQTNPTPGFPRDDGQEIEIRFPDGSRVYIRKNPKRFRIVRSLGRPRKWEFELPAGNRRIQEEKDGPTQEAAPTEGSPREITPSEHPKPAGTPGGSKSDKPKKSRPKRRPKKASTKKKPKKRAPKKKAARRRRR